MSARRLVTSLALVVSVGLVSSSGAHAFALRVTGSASAPRMVFDQKMRVASVCLPVTNPVGGQSLLYGQRFSDGPANPSSPAIVLVHGIASSTENWDFSPTWSVARALASAGYVVFSYDRLGYAKSTWYSQPGGGYTLTTQAHRSMLHDVVGDVKSGGCRVSASGDCRASCSTSSISRARHRSSTRRSARSPTSVRCTPRTTPTSR
jgi:hypothetical protein